MGSAPFLYAAPNWPLAVTSQGPFGLLCIFHIRKQKHTLTECPAQAWLEILPQREVLQQPLQVGQCRGVRG